MKTFTLALAIAATAMPAMADAQRWQPVAQRQANLDARIEQGVRSGRLTRPEARRLTAEYRQLTRLEARYRADGLSRRERDDLNRRYDALSARVRFQKNDGQTRRW